LSFLYLGLRSALAARASVELGGDSDQARLKQRFRKLDIGNACLGMNYTDVTRRYRG